MSLERLLRPNTIAVIGGGAWCADVIKQCRNTGFAGELLAVHPRRKSVEGVDAVTSVTELPWSPDACFIGVNRNATVSVLRELSNKKAGGAVCFASGFEESDDADGATLQAQLLEAAGNVSVLGPNCYGYINNLDGAALWPDQHGLTRQERGVAILTQSSNIAINLTMQKRALPIAYIVTTGNQAQQDLATAAMSLLSDERVSAIGLHIEGFKDIVGFEQLVVAARKKNVPIVATKVGASEEAQLATQSHTASLAGSQAGAQALLSRLGVVSVNSLPEFLESLKLLHVYGPLPAGRLASMSCSGGEASLIADTVHRYSELSLPAVSESGSKILQENLGPHVSKVNPLDYHTDIWRDRKAMATVFGALTGEPYDLTVLVLDFPRNDVCDDVDWLIAIDAIVDAAKQPGARVAVLASLVENLPEHHATTLMQQGVAPLMEFDVALSSLAAIVRCHEPSELSLWAPQPVNNNSELTLVNEFDAKQALVPFGVEVPNHQCVSSPGEAQQASSRMNFPVVVKGLGVAHKSEMGLVALNVNSPEGVFLAATGMENHTTRWLVETMVSDVVAELLVGVVHDRAHGFVLTLATGGTLTELMSDGVSLLLPVGAPDIKNALKRLKVYPLLIGYRGKTGCNIDAIITQVLALQKFVESHQQQIREIEINPLLCTTESAVAADALLMIEGQSLA